MEDGKPESAPGAGSEKTHNVFIESDQRPDILIEKYKLHKQEAMHHQLLQSRETNYIQLFGLFLFFDGHTYIWRKAADRSFEGSWLH